ncbi:MAG: Flp family type IVb pilin [Firmicutes bacterium]|nr:Flp family type IVb pilin [Bacillota bacterium]
MEIAKKFWCDESGQGMAEYGLILALIAVVVIGTLTAIGTNINAKFQSISTALSGGGGGGGGQ